MRRKQTFRGAGTRLQTKVTLHTFQSRLYDRSLISTILIVFSEERQELKLSQDPHTPPCIYTPLECYIIRSTGNYWLC